MRVAKQALHGWVVLDKPAGLTSVQAMAAVRRMLGPQKIGHAGTLDPLANGCLPLALGEATKLISYAMDGRKRYRVTLEFGISTDSYDAEGQVVACSDVRPSDAAIQAALPSFTGEIMQMPPAYSAIKIGGKRAYDLARAGKEVALAARPVVIHSLEFVQRLDADRVVLDVVCGKGTYIRSLVQDLAGVLGAHAHMVGLRRLEVGFFSPGMMISLEKCAELLHISPLEQGALEAHSVLYPPEAVLDDIPAVRVNAQQAHWLLQGRRFPVAAEAVEDLAGQVHEVPVYQAVLDERLVALVKPDGNDIQPVRCFPGLVQLEKGDG